MACVRKGAVRAPRAVVMADTTGAIVAIAAVANVHPPVCNVSVLNVLNALNV